MKKLLLVVIVLAVAGVQAWKVIDRKADVKFQRERVSNMLERLKSGSVPDEQDAIGYWHAGHPETASTETANDFAKFRGQRDLGRVESYSVDSAEMVETGSYAGRYVELAITVNGRPLKLHAYLYRPLQWAD